MSDEFLKLLIIGDSGVGKSCILSRFCQNKFIQAFYNTIGVDFKTKTINLDNKKCKLQIWDTAGQERFRTITANYYKGAHGILIVFDVTEPDTLKSVAFWLEQIEKHGNTHCSTILIGNKTDMISKRKVTEDEGLDFAKKHKLDYIECSAYNAVNIDLVFETVVKKVLRQRAKKQEAFIQTPLSGRQVSNAKLNEGKSGQNSNNKCC